MRQKPFYLASFKNQNSGKLEFEDTGKWWDVQHVSDFSESFKTILELHFWQNTDQVKISLPCHPSLKGCC